MTDLNQMAAQAVDLDKVRLEKQARDAAAQQAALEQVARWDRAMKRTFKGIIGGNDSKRRRFYLQRAADRIEAEGRS